MTATIMQYACQDPEVEQKRSGGSSAISNAAARLLPNYDPTRDNDTAYMLDLLVRGPCLEYLPSDIHVLASC